MRTAFEPLLKRLRPRSVELLADINLSTLRQIGISGIILDLDNTIVSEDDKWSSPYAFQWVEKAKYENFKLFILSNGKSKKRAEYWSHYLGIPALNTARKPIPISFIKALHHMKLTSSQVVVIGDSFHTDIIGAWLMRCRAIQVASLPHRPRIWEKYIGHIVHRPYPKHRQLTTAKVFLDFRVDRP